jgi:PAS domain S-box-containing protein
MHTTGSLDSSNLQQRPRNWFSGRDLTVFFLIVLAYVVAGRFNIYLIHMRPPASSLWAPAGIALAAVLLNGRRFAPAVFLGSFLLTYTTFPGVFVQSVCIALGNLGEVLVGAYLVEKYAGGCKAFSRPADYLRFCLLGGLATAVSAVVGAAVLSHSTFYGIFNFSSTLIAWWAGDALAVMVVTPFLVLLLDGTHQPLHLREFAEVFALLTGLSIVCVLAFGPTSLSTKSPSTAALLCMPFLVWVALRFCQLEAAGTCMVLCGFATWGSLHGFGPFADASLPIPLAAYLCLATAMTLTVAAAVANQREISEQLLENFYRLEQNKDFEISRLTSELELFRDELTRRVHARSCPPPPARELQRPATEANPNAHDAIWFLDAETENVLYVSPSFEAISGRSNAALRSDPHAWLDAVHPEDREFAMLFVGREYPGDKLETTYRVLRPDGSIRWIFDRGFVIRDLSGKAVRFLGVASDITEQVQQGEVVPLQLGYRPTVDLREGEAGTQIRRKQE